MVVVKIEAPMSRREDDEYVRARRRAYIYVFFLFSRECLE